MVSKSELLVDLINWLTKNWKCAPFSSFFFFFLRIMSRVVNLLRKVDDDSSSCSDSDDENVEVGKEPKNEKSGRLFKFVDFEVCKVAILFLFSEFITHTVVLVSIWIF